MKKLAVIFAVAATIVCLYSCSKKCTGTGTCAATTTTAIDAATTEATCTALTAAYKLSKADTTCTIAWK